MIDNNYLYYTILIIGSAFFLYFKYLLMDKYKIGVGLYTLFLIIILFLIYIGQLLYYKGNIPANKANRDTIRKIYDFNAISFVLGIFSVSLLLIIILDR